MKRERIYYLVDYGKFKRKRQKMKGNSQSLNRAQCQCQIINFILSNIILNSSPALLFTPLRDNFFFLLVNSFSSITITILLALVCVCAYLCLCVCVCMVFPIVGRTVGWSFAIAKANSNLASHCVRLTWLSA